MSGACYDYTDCDCNLQNGYASGSISNAQDGGPGEGYIDFWWWAANLEQFDLSDCPSGQCQSTGAVAQPVWYADDYIAYSSIGC